MRVGALSDKDITRALNDGRAKLTWGTPPDDVRAWLKSAGVPDADIEPLIQRTVNDLAAEVRTRGIFDVLVGAPLVALSAWATTSWQFAMSMWGGFIVLLPGFAGLVLLVRGAIRLTSTR